MKYVFVDTNILVDLIADRKTFSNFAIDLFSQAENQKSPIPPPLNLNPIAVKSVFANSTSS